MRGPVTLHLRARSTRSDALFAVTLEDLAPDGRSVDLSGGAQLGSLRALDTAATWYAPDGTVVRPQLTLTRASRRPVPVGEPVGYEVEIRPTFATIAAGHRLRVRVATADFPHLIPLADLANLAGGAFDIERGPAASSLDMAVATGG